MWWTAKPTEEMSTNTARASPRTGPVQLLSEDLRVSQEHVVYQLFYRLTLCGIPRTFELISFLIHAQLHTGWRGAGSCDPQGSLQAQERGA